MLKLFKITWGILMNYKISRTINLKQKLRWHNSYNMDKNKKDKKKYSGFPGDCSEEQLTTLDKFRGYVNTLNQGHPNQKWNDDYLLRFLRARKFSLKQTEKMWFDFIKWRKEMDIDNYKSFYMPHLPELRKMYPHGHHKYDKQHRPIYIERVGGVNIDEIKKLTNEKQMLRYYAMGYEVLLDTIMEACSKQRQIQTGSTVKVSQTCNILDLKGFKITHAPKAYDFAKPATEMGQLYYPEILGNMFIINAPMLFTGVWAVAKMWIDEKTREKIHILGSSYKKELLKYIDPECLPTFIDGGTCTCHGCQTGNSLSINIGPWNPEGHQLHPHLLVKPEDKLPIKKVVEEELPEEVPLKVQLKEEKNKEVQTEKEEEEESTPEEKTKNKEEKQIKLEEVKKEYKNEEKIEQPSEIGKHEGMGEQTEASHEMTTNQGQGDTK